MINRGLIISEPDKDSEFNHLKSKPKNSCHLVLHALLQTKAKSSLMVLVFKIKALRAKSLFRGCRLLLYYTILLANLLLEKTYDEEYISLAEKQIRNLPFKFLFYWQLP